MKQRKTSWQWLYNQFYRVSVIIRHIDEIILMFPNLYIKYVLLECSQLTSEGLLWVT